MPIPVGLILEEFPALGRLDSLVRDINLVRKRRISALTAAQSLAQFDHVYPRGERPTGCWLGWQPRSSLVAATSAPPSSSASSAASRPWPWPPSPGRRTQRGTAPRPACGAVPCSCPTI